MTLFVELFGMGAFGYVLGRCALPGRGRHRWEE